jgi:hypothetical protein
MVKELRSLSGFGWDDERKMVTAAPEVWDEYLKVSSLVTNTFLITYFMSLQNHPKANPWRKKPFPLYDDISELVDGTRATGQNAFRAGQMRRSSSASQILTTPTSSSDQDSAIDPTLLEDDEQNSQHQNKVDGANSASEKNQVMKKSRVRESDDSRSVCCISFSSLTNLIMCT